jgi:adenylylsulfate kinase
VKCPIAVLAERDVKGLYKKALAGEIKEFTGVSDPYEEPLAPEVVVSTDVETLDQSTKKILEALAKHGLLGDDSEAVPMPYQRVTEPESATGGWAIV